MKDIDFDELDRAVNSLISGKPSDDTPAVPAADTTSSIPVTTTSDTPTSAPTAPLAARRSSGRFMDVVHPSSDMRSSTGGAEVAPTPFAQRVTITPPDEKLLEAETASAPEEEAAPPAPTTWPDPLDFQQSGDSKETETPVATEEPQETPPLESPFLSDAKVEKRPLGAFSTASPESTNDEPLDPSAEPATRESGLPIESDTPMPAELQNNLLSIESNEDAAPTPQEASPSPAPEEPVGPTSIVQQYTEKPSTGGQPTATMFDSEAYKKPLAHPKKKKSGWLMVLWIFLLLVVGAGAGAAVYFYVLPLI